VPGRDLDASPVTDVDGLAIRPRQIRSVAKRAGRSRSRRARGATRAVEPAPAVAARLGGTDSCPISLEASGPSFTLGGGSLRRSAAASRQQQVATEASTSSQACRSMPHRDAACDALAGVGPNAKSHVAVSSSETNRRSATFTVQNVSRDRATRKRDERTQGPAGGTPIVALRAARSVDCAISDTAGDGK